MKWDPILLTLLFETATFTGTDSYDPDGGTITKYQWEFVSVPEGAIATFSQNDQAVVSNFMPDVAGDYVAEPHCNQ